MIKERRTQIGIVLGGLAACLLLFLSGSFLGQERDPRKVGSSKIPGLASLPAPDLVDEADEAQVEKGSEDERETEPGDLAEGADTPTEVEEGSYSETSEATSPEEGSSGSEDSSEPPPKKPPPLESVAGQ